MGRHWHMLPRAVVGALFLEGEVGRALHRLVQLKMSLLCAEGFFWVIPR